MVTPPAENLTEKNGWRITVLGLEIGDVKVTAVLVF